MDGPTDIALATPFSGLINKLFPILISPKLLSLAIEGTISIHSLPSISFSPVNTSNFLF